MFNKMMTKANLSLVKITNKLQEERGDFAADKGLVIAITVAIAGIALLLVSGTLKNVIAPALETAIKGFFTFK